MRTRLKGITGVRLEVLADDALPHRGPGRQDNGNLHLSEFRIEVTEPGQRRPIAIARAVADFDQAGWDIGKAIDGKRDTAWGIYPQVGQSHSAAFILKEPIAASSGGVDARSKCSAPSARISSAA